MGKRVTVKTDPWDYGPKMLASILPNPNHDVVSEFKAYLRVREISDKKSIESHAVIFCKQRGYTSNIEPAIEIDADGKRRNPNNAKRRKKRNWIAVMHDKGSLTDKQFLAAERMQQAYEKLGRSPACIKEINVDSSSKPDQNVAIMIDRISGFREVMRAVPRASRPVVVHVVLDNRAIAAYGGRSNARHMEWLRTGLDAVYDAVIG